MFLGLSVCVSVCLSVRPLDYLESSEQILMQFFGEVGRGPRIKSLNFGGCVS